MKLNNEVINQYISYFFSRLVGFKSQEIKYSSMNKSNNEFLSIAMDKIDRLTRKSGRLRNRVWSNCYFIFHDNKIEPLKVYKDKFKEIKRVYPFLFIRSYVYFVFVNISNQEQLTILNNSSNKIKTRDYKIWLFNSKYEIQEETRRVNLFGINLGEKEVVDDYIYLANVNSELQRIESANSDAVDCVRAFTGDLELLEQTSKMLEVVRVEFKNNSGARIIVEGPARSGKTIIAATLLGEYKESKFLLMNYFFYQAIIDGFHALSDWSTKEIEELVKNPELDFWLNIKNKFPKLLKKISENLKYAIWECDHPRGNSNTKKWLIENIKELTEGHEKVDFKKFFILKSLIDLESKLSDVTDENSFININKDNLLSLQARIDYLLSDNISKMHELITETIEEVIRNSKQKFFHHNINKKISSKVKDGCWIERGNPTNPKMWGGNYHPKLIICDEVQRLGLIPQYGNYDNFDEIDQILMHSEQSFFTGDNFQMLNSKYDQGIERISNQIKSKGQSFSKYKIPESVGVPKEIGILMKYLTNPQSVPLEDVLSVWEKEREFEITFIENNVDHLIKLFDGDESNKKHLASPIDYNWIEYKETIQINSCHRKNPIISLQDHEKENFAYKFPYFCNEEIMPNYILSAYELISREVESLYIHIPNFKAKKPEHEEWYRKHLYVLFTRPTSKLIVNFNVKNEFSEINRRIKLINKNSRKVSVTIF